MNTLYTCRDDNGKIHRKDGPAVIMSCYNRDGRNYSENEQYYLEGKLRRVDNVITAGPNKVKFTTYLSEDEKNDPKFGHPIHLSRDELREASDRQYDYLMRTVGDTMED